LASMPFEDWTQFKDSNGVEKYRSIISMMQGSTFLKKATVPITMNDKFLFEVTLMLSLK
jgi:hypothetical protein